MELLELQTEQVDSFGQLVDTICQYDLSVLDENQLTLLEYKISASLKKAYEAIKSSISRSWEAIKRWTAKTLEFLRLKKKKAKTPAEKEAIDKKIDVVKKEAKKKKDDLIDWGDEQMRKIKAKKAKLDIKDARSAIKKSVKHFDAGDLQKSADVFQSVVKKL